MAETIKIGGELESTATGNIVAAANAIKDKTKNKTQSVINTEVDAAFNAQNGRIATLEEAIGTGGSVDTKIATAKSEILGEVDADYNTLEKVEGKLKDRYTKSETYSKEQLNNMITTPEIEYVNTEATDQTTDISDVLPATGAANTIYKIGSWDGSQYDISKYSEYTWNGSSYVYLATRDHGVDDVPIAGSNNLIKSGGVQNELALGAVYDVSAKNLTAGPNNDGKWESLAALLSDANLSTLIPTSVRKGGMSIKFVQSSDNKYVQYFLNKDEWSANEADWEKINMEEEISQLVQFLNPNKQAITTEIGLDDTYLDYNTETRVSALSYAITKGIPVVKGDLIIAELVAETSVASIFKSSSGGYYTEENIKVKGTGNTKSTYYLYCDFNGYVACSYKKSYGIEVTKLHSNTLANIEAEIANTSSSLGTVSTTVNKLIQQGYLYMGVAYTNSVMPTNPVKNYFYIAVEKGTYTNFGVTIDKPSIICSYNGTIFTRKLGIPFENLSNSPLNMVIGYTDNRGQHVEVNNRITTGVILSEENIVIYVPPKYGISYYYGDDPTNMDDGGYLINEGGYAELSLNTKYVAFNIVNLYGNFASVDDILFFIGSANTNDGKLIKNLFTDLYPKVEKIGVFTNWNLVIGMTNSSGEVLTNITNRKTPGVIPSNRAFVVTVHAGYSVVLYYGNTATSLSDGGYVIRDGGYYEYNGSAKYVAFNIVRTDAADMDVNEDTGFFVCAADSELATLIKKGQNATILTQEEIKRQFINNVAISELDTTLCESNGVDINNKGLVAVGYGSSSTSYGEASSGMSKACLSIANIADLQGTKKTVDVFQVNQTYDGFGEIESIECVSAKFISDDVIIVMANLGFYVSSEKRKAVFCTRTYTISTDTLSSTITSVDINVLGTIYEMSSEYDGNWGLNHFSQSTIDNINAIWTATGIEHYVGYDLVNKYTYWLCANAIKYDGYWWSAISMGNQSHALCKSSDYIHWEYVCDMPFGQASEEIGICFYGTKLYATSRGNYTRVGGPTCYSKIMSCPINDIGNWTTPIELTGCKYEGPTIAGHNNKILVYQGRGENSIVEGVEIARGKKSIFVFDVELKMLSRNDLDFTYDFYRPLYIPFGGGIYLVVATDKRRFAFTYHGDGRAEMSVGLLDPEILSMRL